VAFERASRLEVEECGRRVGLALCFDLRLGGCGERDLGRLRVDTRSELLRFLDGGLLALGVPLGLVSVALAVVVGDMGMSLGVTGNAMRLSRIEPDRFSDT